MNSTKPALAPAKPIHCLVRAVPQNFAECLREDPVSIDREEALAQHGHYVSLLKRHCKSLTFVPVAQNHADSVYIEDVAVILDSHALVTRPGAPSRRAETEGIADALSPFCTVHTTDAPALLDGGDVMRIGNELLVGLSKRTNTAGFHRLKEVALLDGVRAHAVEVKEGLHLKSAMTALKSDTIIYDPLVMKPLEVAGLRLNWLAAPEPLGANVLAFGDVTIVSKDAPETAQLLRQHGHHVETVQVTELHKGDGALTCLSLRIPAPGCWTV
jgi:dimethylargininase